MRNQDTIIKSDAAFKGNATPIIVDVPVQLPMIPTDAVRLDTKDMTPQERLAAHHKAWEEDGKNIRVTTPVRLTPIVPEKYATPDPSIKGRPAVVSYTRAEDMPEWLAKDWSTIPNLIYIKEMAYLKMEYNPSLTLNKAIDKSVWQVILNQASELYINAYKFSGRVKTVVQNALANGIGVTLYDQYTEQMYYFDSHYNAALNPINQDFLISKDVPNHNGIIKKLESVQKKYEEVKWNAINRELATISTTYLHDKKESRYETIITERNKEIRETLDRYNISVEVSTFLKYDYPRMAQTVEMYGATFGYNVKTRESEVHRNMYTTTKRYAEEGRKYGINPEYAKTVAPTEVANIDALRDNNEYAGGQEKLDWETKNLIQYMDVDVRYFHIGASQKHIAESQPDYVEVINAYFAIKWIMENDVVVEMSDDDAMLCPGCGCSLRTNFLVNDEAICDRCDTVSTVDNLIKYHGQAIK